MYNMKFENENKKKSTFIVLIMLILFFILIFSFLYIVIHTYDKTEWTFLIAIICFIIMLITFFKETSEFIKKSNLKKNLQDKFMAGEKTSGYIVSTFKYRYSIGRAGSRTSYGLKVLANNQIYIVDRLENNEAYKEIETKLNNIQINNDITSFEKIPVDIYLKNDDYYVDIESIK